MVQQSIRLRTCPVILRRNARRQLPMTQKVPHNNFATLLLLCLHSSSVGHVIGFRWSDGTAPGNSRALSCLAAAVRAAPASCGCCSQLPELRKPPDLAAGHPLPSHPRQPCQNKTRADAQNAQILDRLAATCQKHKYFQVVCWNTGLFKSDCNSTLCACGPSYMILACQHLRILAMESL